MRSQASRNSVEGGFSRGGRRGWAAVFAPLLICGAAVVIAQAAWRGRVGKGEDFARRARRLSRAMVGNTKHGIAAAMGMPQASADLRGAGAGAADGVSGAVFRSDTWYYRLEGRERAVLVIEFENDVATDVRVLGVGGASRKREMSV